MSPYRHGEVCVTGDGSETDLDLGYYERLIDENLNQFSGLTTEQPVYPYNIGAFLRIR